MYALWALKRLNHELGDSIYEGQCREALAVMMTGKHIITQ